VRVIIALGDIYAQIPVLEEVRELMRLTQARVREQPGCVRYAFTEMLEDPGHFVVVQEWREMGALQEHYRSRAFADYQAQIAPRLVRTSELRVHVAEETLLPVDSSVIDISDDD
jgi:quinol monooxygenase YgiN